MARGQWAPLLQTALHPGVMPSPPPSEVQGPVTLRADPGLEEQQLFGQRCSAPAQHIMCEPLLFVNLLSLFRGHMAMALPWEWDERDKTRH